METSYRLSMHHYELPGQRFLKTAVQKYYSFRADFSAVVSEV